jgi:hypothetical protein
MYPTFKQTKHYNLIHNKESFLHAQKFISHFAFLFLFGKMCFVSISGVRNRAGYISTQPTDEFSQFNLSFLINYKLIHIK